MRLDEILEQTGAKAVPLVQIVGVLPQGYDPGITDHLSQETQVVIVLIGSRYRERYGLALCPGDERS